MAQKRMFDKRVIDSDSFLEMPLTTQAVYFHFNMRADDDGFVDNWKGILRLIGGKEDDLRVLISKRFIIPFHNGVIVITHWKINNLLRKDRYVETIHQWEKNQLTTGENGEYLLGTPEKNLNNDDSENTDETKEKTFGIPLVYQMTPQYSREEYSIVENSISTTPITHACEEELKKADDTETRETKKTLFEFMEDTYQKIFNGPEQDTINGWIDNDVTRFAIGQAALQGISNVKYIETILEAYKREGITTLEQAKERERKFQENKTKHKKQEPPTWFNKNIEETQVNDDELATLNEMMSEFKEEEANGINHS